MSQNLALILFEFVALIFAFSIHECAHAWTASRLGDQTARMLGRVTLNPIKHLDPIGSVIMPLVAAFTGAPLIGWAKPCPVTPRNLHKYKRDDILVTLAGPGSNLLVAVCSLILLLAIKHIFSADSVFNAANFALGADDASLEGHSVIYPISLLFYCSILVNLTMVIFNLLPIPPLDGSRILRHYLPYNAVEMYDQIGGFANLIILWVLIRSGVIGALYRPALSVFNRVLEAM